MRRSALMTALLTPEAEELGLDLPEMGALAYPDSAELASAVVLKGTIPGARKETAAA
jgi:hypothetical protein